MEYLMRGQKLPRAMVRRSVDSRSKCCSLCGNRPRTVLHEYGFADGESDKIEWKSGQFCSMACFETYHHS